MSKTALKQLPTFTTDEEAEEFVDSADLSEYDLSGFIPMHLALNQPKDEMYVLVPNDLAAAVRAKAEQQGVAFSDIVREALERNLAK